MSGTKTSRADLKNRFKKGMYPTEGDFANVFESYVHKDDDISMSKVVLTDGDGNTTTLNNVIGNKADKTDLTEITNRLTTAENDIDTAEDNIAGHETRIKSLEAFKERVRAFLEDADASDETINHWHEIESFLQGITDTQTLTGLLADLKQEILASIPEPQTGNYLKLVPDLDAYTDAPDGEIVKYTGPTNNKYTHGFDYEKVGGDALVVPGEHNTIENFSFYNETLQAIATDWKTPFYPNGTVNYDAYSYLYLPEGTVPEVGGKALCFSSNGDIYTISQVTSTYFKVSGLTTQFKFADKIAKSLFRYTNEDGVSVLADNLGVTSSQATYTSVFYLPSDDLIGSAQYTLLNHEEGITIGSPASWQPCKSMSVID